jgi:hypothetical protein
MRVELFFLTGILLAGVGCNRPDARAESAPAGGVVDSALPREEALRRFTDGLPPADSLVGGAESRDELVAELMGALARSDTAALAGLAVTRSEFAYLYYPTSPRGKPPYDLEPGLMWFMLVQQRDRGLSRALERYGGTPISLLDDHCGEGVSREGENAVHGPCTVRWTGAGGDTLSVRLFSQILEHGGRFKFLNYGNRLD